MSTFRVIALLGILTTAALVATGSMVYAAKKRSAEVRQSQSKAEVAFKTDTFAHSTEAAVSSSELTDPFGQLSDPLSGVKSTLSNSVYSEAQLSNTNITGNDLPSQVELDRIAGLAIEK